MQGGSCSAPRSSLQAITHEAGPRALPPSTRVIPVPHRSLFPSIPRGCDQWTTMIGCLNSFRGLPPPPSNTSLGGHRSSGCTHLLLWSSLKFKSPRKSRTFALEGGAERASARDSYTTTVGSPRTPEHPGALPPRRSQAGYYSDAPNPVLDSLARDQPIPQPESSLPSHIPPPGPSIINTADISQPCTGTGPRESPPSILARRTKRQNCHRHHAVSPLRSPTTALHT